MGAVWKTVLPQLANVEDTVIQELFERASQVAMPALTTIFHQGDRCSNYLLVLEGDVKVLTRAANGREIVLYRLGAGDTCVLTTSCLFGHSRYPAEGVTESDVTALAIPANTFHEALQASRTFREFVFRSFTTHLASVITLVEEVAFGRLDSRLARYLADHCGTGMVLKTTHQALATELGSAREVISRQLKEFELRGSVALQRGSIRILDKAALEKIAAA